MQRALQEQRFGNALFLVPIDKGAERSVSKRKSFPLRLSPNLYRALQRMADQELRSVNGQIEFLLRKAVQDAGVPLEPDEPQKEKDQETDS